MNKKQKYTHRKKGGCYEIIIDGSQHSTIKTNGSLAGSTIILYKCTNTNQIYAMLGDEFFKTMVKYV